MNFRQFCIGLLRLLFGSFNGMQVILYPMALVFWLNINSFQYVSIGLFTSHKYYFPLLIFLVVFILVVLLILKNYSELSHPNQKLSQEQKNSIAHTIIGLHKILLVVMFAVGLIYLVYAFLNHYYGISLPLSTIYTSLARFVSVGLILGYALRNAWTSPHRENGMDVRRALVMVRKDFRSRPRPFLLHGFSFIIMALLACGIYNNIVMNVLDFFIGRTGFSLHLAHATGLLPLIYDVFLLFVALLLSNLVFSPLVLLVNSLSHKMIPQPIMEDLDEENDPQEQE
jgi:hypothetical protein